MTSFWTILSQVSRWPSAGPTLCPKPPILTLVISLAQCKKRGKASHNNGVVLVLLVPEHCCAGKFSAFLGFDNVWGQP